jgi:hypothetical protein
MSSIQTPTKTKIPPKHVENDEGYMCLGKFGCISDNMLIPSLLLLGHKLKENYSVL